MRDPVLTFGAMGTGVRVHSERSLPHPLARAIRACFEELEARYSLYRPESEASRVAEDARNLAAASPEFLAAYEDAIGWRTRTDGDFTPHRPDGRIDLSGIVKAYALRQAAAILADSPAPWLLEAGGDLMSGPGAGSADGGIWTVGIADPDGTTDRPLLTAVPLGGAWRAIATSGTSERGEHIWRTTRLGRLRQVTVLGDDIVSCDVVATAILAGGLPALDRATERWSVEVLTVSDDGAMRVTPGLRRVIGAAVPPSRRRNVPETDAA